MFTPITNVTLIYSGGTLITAPPVLAPLSGIQQFWTLTEDSTGLQSVGVGGTFFTSDPGFLFSSSGAAFFTTDERVSNLINEIRATAPPLRIIVEVVRRMTEGRLVSVLDVDSGNFTMTLTGAPTKILDITIDNRILYRQNTLTIRLGVLETIEFPDINTFAVFQLELGSTNTQYRILFTETPDVIWGPGQVYISLDENSAFFVEDFSFRGGDRDVIGFINERIFRLAFAVEEIDMGVNIRDSDNNKLITLTTNTSKFDIPNAAEVTYTGSQLLLTIRDRGGRVNSFPNIELFSIFENNTLQSFNDMSGVSMHFLCTGGTVFVDGLEALFTSDSNPFAVSELCGLIPLLDGISYVYDIVPDIESRLLLRSIRRNITSTSVTEEQTPIQVITGSYVTSVAEGEAVSFRDNTILIRDFFDNTVTQIEGVDMLFVNTESEPFRGYENHSPIPFHGPGTLSYSRGTAFFTTDRLLGRDIVFMSRRAGVPHIDVEIVSSTIVEINGENFTQSTAVLEIGGDRVVTFETSSYRTSTEQEILYENGLVTVHQPVFTGEGTVTYVGSNRTVTYTDMRGRTRNINNVDTFQEFSGGEVKTTTSAENAFVEGPGKIYVSEDGTNVLFSSSNLITAEVAEIIRRGIIDFSFEADQLSTIHAGVFNLSTDAATVTYPGGGLIYYSEFEGRKESLYIDSQALTNIIRQHISALVPLTKSVADEDQGIIHLIFNGRSVFSYMPVALGSSDILVSETTTFVYDGTNITGLPVGTLTGINSLITYNGLQIEMFNESNTPVDMRGYGLLLVNMNSGTAFYTTLPYSVVVLLQTIKDLREFLISPQIKEPRENKVTTKLLMDTFQFGTNVRAFEGASITFTCTARGRPTPTFTFFREIEGGLITLNGSEMRVSVDGDSLTLSSISDVDSGTYGCRADNNVPPADEARSVLTIEEAGLNTCRTTEHSDTLFSLQLHHVLGQDGFHLTCSRTKFYSGQRYWEEVVLLRFK